MHDLPESDPADTPAAPPPEVQPPEAATPPEVTVSEQAPEAAAIAEPEATAEPVPEPPAQATPPEAAHPAVPELSPAAAAAKLAELFPALFGGPPKPIKLRIQADIQARAPGVFSKRVLSLFLHRHTTSTAYLRAMVQNAQRFDLDGVAAGDVAAEHLEAAKAEVERRRAIVKERIRTATAAQRPPQRPAPPPKVAATPGEPAAGGPAPPARDAERTAVKARRKEQRDRPVADRGPRPQREPTHQQAPRQQVQQHPPRQNAPRPEAHRLPEDQARRDRANLLRMFETSTLKKANFCVLKRISEAELDAQLKLAREERDAWFQAHPPPARPAPARPR